MTPDDIQREWKAQFGCPILAAEDDAFAAVWRRAEFMLTWEERVEWMRFVPVTR